MANNYMYLVFSISRFSDLEKRARVAFVINLHTHVDLTARKKDCLRKFSYPCSLNSVVPSSKDEKSKVGTVLVLRHQHRWPFLKKKRTSGLLHVSVDMFYAFPGIFGAVVKKNLLVYTFMELTARAFVFLRGPPHKLFVPYEKFYGMVIKWKVLTVVYTTHI